MHFAVRWYMVLFDTKGVHIVPGLEINAFPPKFNLLNFLDPVLGSKQYENFPLAT